MKNKIFILIFIIFIIFFSLYIRAEPGFGTSFSSSSSITPTSTIEGNLFTNITTTTIPILVLINPKNNTYFDNNSIPLNYSVTNADNVWYSLDSGTNISIGSSTYFNVSEGSHQFYIYANNSVGSISQNVTFFVNSNRFKIIANNYTTVNKGSSTNFTILSYEEVQNLSNIILENINYGKINFNQKINMTDDSNFSDNQVDLDSNTNVSFNRIELNSINLPNFNKSATLYFYNLTFTNPLILKDGNICPPEICTEDSYSAGILKFDVTSFSVYSAEETPAGPITPSAPSGAGGGAVCNYEWVCSDWYPNPCPQNGIQQKICVNKGTCTGTEGMPNTNQTCIPEIISPSEPLFDIFVNIPIQYKWITPNQAFGFNVRLVNSGNITTTDVFLKYWITDKNNKLILEQQETRAVGKADEFEVRTLLPENLGLGLYKVYAQINYDSNRTAMSEDSFEIVNSQWDIILNDILFFLPLILVGVVLIIILFILFKRKRKQNKCVKEKKKIIKKKPIKKEIIKGYLDLTNKSRDLTDKYLDLTGKKPRFRS